MGFFVPSDGLLQKDRVRVHRQIKDTNYFSALFAILGRGPIELGSGNMAPVKQSQS